MNDQPRFSSNLPDSTERAAVLFTGTARPFREGMWLRVGAALPALLVVALWFVFVYVLPLRNLRASRHTARRELAQLLQTDRPNVPAVLEAFDRATERVLLSASAPYFILGLATFFLIAHLTLVSRRLYLAERNIQFLREAMHGVDGIPFR